MTRKKKITLISVFFLFFAGAFVFWSNSFYKEEKTVNVYGWYGIIPRKIFSDFEKETGIKVIYDVYDNNDSLEAKLLATNCGYDVIFPSFIPYAARQVAMGAYAKLNKDLLPNLENVDGIITQRFKESGGNTDFLVPFFWGTIGIAYESNTVKKIFPNQKIKSFDVLFEKKKIKKLSKYGVSFPEEYVDIFPQTSVFLDFPPNVKNSKNLEQHKNLFKKIRKYITKFSSTTLISDLLSGEVCIAIGSSDNAWRAMHSEQNVNKKIKYVLPEKGTMLWIDCVGIPEKAPHKKNAHLLLNYLLSPEVAVKITNHSGILVNIPKSYENFRDDIKNNTQIFPRDSDLIKNFIIGSPSTSDEDLSFDRKANELWSKIKMNSFEDNDEEEE